MAKKSSQLEYRFFKGTGATEKKIIMRGTESGDDFRFIPQTIDLSLAGVAKNEQEVYCPFRAGAAIKTTDLITFATDNNYNLDKVDEAENTLTHSYTS